MTVQQVMAEIEALPPEGQQQVLVSLQERLGNRETANAPVAYASLDEVERLADRIFTERAELFKKLAQ